MSIKAFNTKAPRQFQFSVISPAGDPVEVTVGVPPKAEQKAEVDKIRKERNKAGARLEKGMPKSIRKSLKDGTTPELTDGAFNFNDQMRGFIREYDKRLIPILVEEFRDETFESDEQLNQAVESFYKCGHEENGILHLALAYFSGGAYAGPELDRLIASGDVDVVLGDEPLGEAETPSQSQD